VPGPASGVKPAASGQRGSADPGGRFALVEAMTRPWPLVSTAAWPVPVQAQPAQAGQDQPLHLRGQDVRRRDTN
jgi:hypothetical protein